MHKTLRRATPPVVVGVLTAATVLLGAAPASAHITVTPSTTVAGEYAVLTFSVGHGCDGSATTDVAIDIPKGIDVVTPTLNDRWTIKKQTEPIPNADTSDEEAVTERTTRVTYSAKSPLADGYRDTFELSVPLPTQPGETLVFPTVQTCEKGETRWTQVPKAGQTEDDLETPAPSMELTTAEEDEGAAEVSTSGDAAGAETEATGSEDDDGGEGMAWTALAVGVAGLAVGGTALTRTRTRD